MSLDQPDSMKTPEAMRREISQVRNDVGQKIPLIREEVYKIQAFQKAREIWGPDGWASRVWNRVMHVLRRGHSSSRAPIDDVASYDSKVRELDKKAQDIFRSWETPPNGWGHKSIGNVDELRDMAWAAESVARELGQTTEELVRATPGWADPESVILMTTKAGFLLSPTERILSGYDRFANCSPEPGSSNLGDILSACMTVVMSAGDQIIAAEAYVKNLKARLGSRETRKLSYIFLGLAFFYVLLHPYWRALYPSVPWSSYSLLPWIMRPYWEMLFWALFGAIGVSVVASAEDTMADDFDPRHAAKYEYRIVLAPVVAFAIISFLNVVSFTVSGVGVGSSPLVDLGTSSPNIFAIIIVSFILGFFSKRTLDILDAIWKRLSLQDSTNGSGKKKT